MSNPWVEAMRLRTLPVSIAGVLAGTGCAVYNHGFNWLPALICLVFAIIAQIASNFANEYYDFKNGFDKKGREGFRRGVTEGDISPSAMKKATYLLIGIDMILGCSLIIWGGWWLVFVGILIGLFALAYSAGPYPLSHHGLGEIAVVVFFGLIPVAFTDYLQTGYFCQGYITPFVALSIGLMGANVLIVNNCRDREDDKAVGKNTIAVIFGNKAVTSIYLANGALAAILLAMATSALPFWVSAGWLSYLSFHFFLWTLLKNRKGAALNPLLRDTSLVMFAMAIYFLIICCIYPR